MVNCAYVKGANCKESHNCASKVVIYSTFKTKFIIDEFTSYKARKANFLKFEIYIVNTVSDNC